jgi:hypothetical protein
MEEGEKGPNHCSDRSPGRHRADLRPGRDSEWLGRHAAREMMNTMASVASVASIRRLLAFRPLLHAQRAAWAVRGL